MINKLIKLVSIYKRKAKYSKVSFSFNAVDLIVDYIFKDQIQGIYIDIGSQHPISNNNTYLLYKKGWSGTNVDLNAAAIDMFNIIRKRDNNKCALISNVNNVEKTVYYEHNFSAVNSLILTKGLKKVLKKEMTMETKTFDDLVDHEFDFLNIDLEGHDYEVLKNINLKKYVPKLICIEILENSEDKDKIFFHMKKNAFELKKICKVSYFFENTN